MSVLKYRKLRDSVHKPRTVRSSNGEFLRHYRYLPRGEAWNRAHKRHVPRDPDIIMYHNMPLNTAPPTVETRILGEALLTAWAMCRAGLLEVAGTRTHSYWSDEEHSSFFEEDDELLDELTMPSISKEELDRLFDEAALEVAAYNKEFGNLDYWSPVTRKWHTRKAQLGDEVQIYRDSTYDPSEFFNEEPKDPNERGDAPGHKYDERYQAMNHEDYDLLGESYLDAPNPDTTPRPLSKKQMDRLNREPVIEVRAKTFEKWVLVGRRPDGSKIWRRISRKEVYEEREASADTIKALTERERNYILSLGGYWADHINELKRS